VVEQGNVLVLFSRGTSFACNVQTFSQVCLRA